jgi:hypothetical protein
MEDLLADGNAALFCLLTNSSPKGYSRETGTPNADDAPWKRVPFASICLHLEYRLSLKNQLPFGAFTAAGTRWS